jgi:hypothetical protein
MAQSEPLVHIRHAVSLSPMPPPETRCAHVQHGGGVPVSKKGYAWYQVIAVLYAQNGEIPLVLHTRNKGRVADTGRTKDNAADAILWAQVRELTGTEHGQRAPQRMSSPQDVPSTLGKRCPQAVPQSLVL